MLHVVLYGLEVARYVLLYRLLYAKKIRNIWMIPSIAVVLVGVFLFVAPEFSDSERSMYACIGTWGAMLIMMQGRWKQRGLELFVLFLWISVVTKIILVPVRLLEVYDVLHCDVNDYENVFASVITILLICVLMSLKKRRDGKPILDFSGTRIYIVVAMMIMGMLITASGLNVVVEYVPSRFFAAFAVIMVAITYASIGMLGWFVIHIRKVNEKMEEMLQNEIVLKEMQKSYYESMLEREADTRKYRHDMVNHFLCLNYFIEQNRAEEIKSYLYEMQEQLSQIQKKCYATGNQVLDAITNHYLTQIDELTEVKVNGQVSDSLPFEQVSLCTIYANLLKNATEELKRVERQTKRLEIEFLQGDICFQMMICNSIAKKSREKENLLETEKEDKRNHGLGLKNVKKAVKECGGEISFQVDEEVFIVKVLLKNDRSRT